MGIRTRETTEYFPKVKNCEQSGSGGGGTGGASSSSSSTRSEAASVIEKSPVPDPPVLAEVKVQGTVEGVHGINGDGEVREEDQEQKGPSSGPKSKGGSKIKNGIVKVNSKMKKGMRIMMEKSNKILERSRNCKKQVKKAIVKPRPAPARMSARLCRKSSGDGDSNDSQSQQGRPTRCAEDPLRTVELIKRPLELRDPATKLLYLASMGLYPMSDPESDSPIVIISEEVVSPGGRRGKMRCMELPLMPSWGNAHSQRLAHPENSLLLQIAPISTPSVSAAPKLIVQPVEGTVPQKSPDLPTEKTGPKKYRKKSAEKGDLRKSTETPTPIPIKISAVPPGINEPRKTPSPPVRLPTQIHPSLGKEISVQINGGITSAAQELSTKVYTGQPVEPVLNHIAQPPAPQKATVSCLKKRKSLETIIKEIPMLKSDLPLLKVQSENTPQASLPIESLSCNPILEGLMNKPVKKRAPKRKPQTDLNQQQASHYQNSITMTVPLQPAPGLATNNFGISIKELANKPKKSKSSFQLPTLLPQSLLSFTSLLPKSSELTFSEKPKKPRKPRTKKPKEVVSNINSFSQQNNFMSMKPNQFPQLPYLPPHLEAFFHNVLPLQNSVPMNPDEALDLCVKARTSDDFRAKKPKDTMIPQSILKPLSSRSTEDDGPLNLVLSRSQGHLSSATGTLPLKTLPENKNIAKPQPNLDSVKQMLARLHTKIAPAVDGVQLITIE